MQTSPVYASPSLLLKSCTTAIPSLGKLAPWLRELDGNLSELAEKADELGGSEMRHWLNPGILAIRHSVERHGHDVYSFPYLSVEFCAALLAEFDGAEFQVNEEEPPEAQIPELVLNYASAPLTDCLRVLYSHTIRHLSRVLFNLDPGQCEMLQVAQYKPDTNPGTQLHTDRDSEVTLVVNLGTPHEGGGTRVVKGLLEKGCVVPSLPVGHAMLFLGRTTMHQGLPVTSGVRTLLVHWTHLTE